MKPLITPEELKQYTGTFVLIDASFGESAYTAGHLENAIYVDLNKQLSDIQEDAANGGRHPLPSPALFAQRLGDLGIEPSTHVVVYDNKQGAMSAARFWWMLRSAGHEKVQVLDGGIQAAIDAGFPLQTGRNIPTPTRPYPFSDWKWPLATIETTELAASSKDHTVIDVREKDRYLGITEPIDLIAGHIPGAINVPFAENLQATGRFKSSEELADHYGKFVNGSASEGTIVHCGSGVTACHTILAMVHAGFPPPQLYVGSWSEWSRNGKTVGKGE